MPTIKPRINVTVEPSLKKAIFAAAEKENIPVAAKAHDLLSLGLELEEDLVLAQIARRRQAKKVKTVSHSKAWK